MKGNYKVFPDSRMPTDEERQKLLKMVHNAFLEIRILGWQGKAKQAADLADAFHNLPVYLWSEDFSFDFFRKFLEAYHQKHPERGYFDYVRMLNEIVKAN